MSDEGSLEDPSLPLPLLQHIDSICTDFETAWQAVAPPRFEEYLGLAHEGERSELLRELLRLELDYRSRRAREFSQAALQRQFPEQEQLIADVFTDWAKYTAPGAAPHFNAPVENGSHTGRNCDSTSVGSDDTHPEIGLAVGQSSSTGQRFRIKRLHAKGGLGEVFLALDQELHRDVVVKEIQSQYANDLSGRARFFLEAEVTGRLEHPGIVPVYGLGTHTDGRPFYAMRFVRGESLQQAIERFYSREAEQPVSQRAIEFRQLLGRFIDICETIEYAHSRGVLHRDVKPSNVMLGRYGETLVVDWGLAKVTDAKDAQVESSPDEPCLIPRFRDSGSADTEMGTALGTPAYMSPEQAIGDVRELSPASDVYSLGATLYTLLTGRAPLEGDSAREIVRRVQVGKFAAPRSVRPRVSRGLEAICLKAMATAPGDRYASARELAADVEAWLADQPVSAYSEPVAARLGRWVRHHRGLVMTVSTAALVAMIVLGASVAVLAAKNRELTASRQAESDAKQQAERRFALALDAIENYYTGVSEDLLLKQTEFDELRNKLLQGSLSFYEKLRKELEPAQDLKSRSALADAYDAIARTCNDLGFQDRAFQAYEAAIELRKALIDESPRGQQYQAQLADSLKRFGLLHRELGNDEQAARCFHKARIVAEELAAAGPNRPYYRSISAEIYHALSMLPRDIQSRQESRDYAQRSLALSKVLADENPNDSELQCRLARICSQYADLLRRSGELQDAKKFQMQAIEIHRKEAERFPENPMHQFDLAIYARILANTLRRLNDNQAALEWDEESTKILERLVQEYPGVSRYQFLLASHYATLGTVQHDAGHDHQAQSCYEQAVRMWERLAANQPRNRSVQRSFSRAQIELARTYSAIGQFEQALQCRMSAAQTQSWLLDEYAEQEDKSALGVNYTEIGRIQKRLGKREDALDSLRKAVQIHEELVAASNDRDFAAYLEAALRSLGVVQVQMNQTEAARNTFARTIEIRESLREDPRDRRNCVAFRFLYRQLAMLDGKLGRMEDAATSLDKAIEINERLVELYPETRLYSVELGGLYCERGMFATSASQPDQAFDWFTKAIVALQNVAQEVDCQQSANLWLYKTYGSRAVLFKQLGRYQESVDDWEEASSILPDNRDHCQMQVAHTHALAGDYAEATREAEALLVEDSTGDARHFSAARVYALAAAAAANDEAQTADDRQELASRYAARAVALLRSARQLGLLDDATRRQLLMEDSDFESIRSREEFQTLIQELEREPQTED